MAMGPETMQLVQAISGIIGSVIALTIFLSPIGSFRRIIREKHTAGFKILPYMVTLFSATLYIYYGILKRSSIILTINVIGSIIELFYLGVYFRYSSTQTRVSAGIKLAAFNMVALAAIVLATVFVTDYVRTIVVGTMCSVFSVAVFAAPLSIMLQVIRTGNVESMPPIPLSVALMLSSIFWFIFGFTTSDFFVATPNALGLVFAIAQVVLYHKYRQGPIDTDTALEMEAGQAQDEDSISSPDTVEIADDGPGQAQTQLVVEEEVVVEVVEEGSSEVQTEEVEEGGGEGGEREEEEEKEEEEEEEDDDDEDEEDEEEEEGKVAEEGAEAAKEEEEEEIKSSSS
ncbi:unnamed protein product [Linum tenue]|uniref:Sugar transporter SWEET1 n=1 Tax=Linum tenue TaxID=586396 RepID=A0AAV0HCV0_9ROSI|nr:unnamed protein product [Linum tenue]